jgi:hypothetical protein
VFATMAQMESRVRGSAATVASRAESHPGVASGSRARMATASLAFAALCDQRYRSAAGRSSTAAAWRRHRTTETVCCRQKLAFSTPERPASATRAAARSMAVWGRSHPRTGDQRKLGNSDRAAARPWGSKTATGCPLERAATVRARLSGRVPVETTGPGESRIMGITKLCPLPDRGGPNKRMESSTEAQHSTPTARPRQYPTSLAPARASDGRSVEARAVSAVDPAC